MSYNGIDEDDKITFDKFGDLTISAAEMLFRISKGFTLLQLFIRLLWKSRTAGKIPTFAIPRCSFVSPKECAGVFVCLRVSNFIRDNKNALCLCGMHCQFMKAP